MWNLSSVSSNVVRNELSSWSREKMWKYMYFSCMFDGFLYHKFILLHIYMCVCMYICVCVYIYVYIFIHTLHAVYSVGIYITVNLAALWEIHTNRKHWHSCNQILNFWKTKLPTKNLSVCHLKMVSMTLFFHNRRHFALNDSPQLDACAQMQKRRKPLEINSRHTGMLTME